LFKKDNDTTIKVSSSLVIDSLSFCKFNLLQNEDATELLLAIPKISKNEFVIYLFIFLLYKYIN